MRRIGMFGTVVTVVIFVMRLGTGSASAQSATAKQFIGTWRLVSMESNGQTDPDRGAHPTGLIYYDGTGHMAAQIMPGGPQPTPEEAKAALSGYIAYFGTYSVDERARTVSHHREGSLIPGTVGEDAVRRYEFAAGDRLILIPVENPTTRVTWERIK